MDTPWGYVRRMDHSTHQDHANHADHQMGSTNAMAVAATLHCLTG